MIECWTCHAPGSEAGGPPECKACHPKYFDLLPTSHEPKTWQDKHGEASFEEDSACTMCHEEDLCFGCHQVEMPHPEGWSNGADGHIVFNPADKDVCVQCHVAEPDPCSTCHHRGHNPMRGPWNEQHYWVVRETGTAACMQCHDGPHCGRCHGEDNPPTPSE
jgi:hypothetical protein